MNPLISFLREFAAPFILLAIVAFFFYLGNKNNNPGLPSIGKGKRKKAGGDWVADTTEKVVVSVFKGLWRAIRTIVTAPFR